MPHPSIINTQEGWEQQKAVKKDKFPVQPPKEGTNQANGDKTLTKPSAGYHFTLVIQDMVDSDVVQQKFLKIMITLP